jgi:two-component system response regulator HydG
MTTAAVSAATAVLATNGSDRREIEAVLRDLGFAVVHLEGSQSLEDVVADPIGLCLLDLKQNGDAMRLARVIRAQHPKAVVIGLADPSRPSVAADAIRAGVFDVVPRPPSVADLEALLSNAREQSALAASAPQLSDTNALGIAGTSPAIRIVLDLVQRAAPGRCGIIICGERGTGRELLARAIHARGGSRQPFIKVDCAGPSPEDLELQLFGAVTRRGTQGAAERRSLERIGRHSQLHEAAGGVLFLENVTEIPARGQARLVRVLRDREVFVEDAREPTAVDIRPIASADETLDAALEEGRLRRDLHERLGLIRIDVPALRQRREDIPLLATHLLKDLCRANGRPVKTLTRPALTVLSALPWRGNLPELRIFLERLILLVPHGLIRLEDVLAHTQLEGSSISPTGLDATLKQARARFERDYIAAVLQHHHGRIADAARVLGVQRTNLYRKMRRLNLMRTKV